ncbi:hypothetical protein C0Q70_05377 [Pomacea canaliculata]|uniref:Voltage-gated hydrogen channel 1 n=1 Tax=Pomacea canaliculata TaxID=400727 RepID=A0A2T7PL39_POMCA|nr:hypothetical protein C0Q70_05377 [Pomacea canaliculata]
MARCRKRLSILMHTHVALIVVCTLAALDAACVIGQIICDILIMKETLHEWDELDKNLTTLLKVQIPDLNATEHDPEALNLKKIRDILLKPPIPVSSRTQPASSFNSDGKGELVARTLREHHQGTDAHWNLQNTRGEEQAATSRRGDLQGTHKLLHDLTHSFHLGSLIILSMLLLETLLKVFAMGKKVLHHKLEIFDAFVVSVSWALDVAFWEGIWAHPGEEAATILIFILPWRVVRIVNSFVLVIQEKDHVQLKIVKQRLRLSVKRTNFAPKLSLLHPQSALIRHPFVHPQWKVPECTEVKQLQGLCRKYGATENEINACGPTGRSGRRRSSLVPVMEQAAALTLIGALGSHPSLYTMESSSDEDDLTSRDLTHGITNGRTLRSAYSCTTLDSADGIYTIDSKRNSEGYITSDNESTADGLDNPVFENEDVSTSGPRRRHRTDPQEESHVVWQRETLQEVPCEASRSSETPSSESSSQGAADTTNQDVPPTYHEVLTQQVNKNIFLLLTRYG